MLQTTRPLFVFDVPGIRALLDPPANGAHMWDTATVLPRMPPDLHEPLKDRGGWFWWDETGPVYIGPFVALGRRQYHKRIPGGLLEPKLKEAITDWCTKTGSARAPKDIRVHLREGIEDGLLMATLPSVRETGVLFDVVNERVFVFNASREVRLHIWSAIRALSGESAWKDAIGDMDERESALVSYLQRLRPGVALPDDVTDMFGDWLFEQAKADVWFHVKPMDKGDSVRLGLRLDSAVELLSGDVKVTARGDAALDTFVDHQINDGAEISSAVKKIRVQVLTPEDRGFIMRMDESGRAMSVRLCAPVDIGKDHKFESIAADILARATDWHYAHELVLTLYRIFDATVLAPHLKAAKQTQMFPGGPAATAKAVAFSQDWEPNVLGTPDVGGLYHQWDEPLGLVFDGTTGRPVREPKAKKEPKSKPAANRGPGVTAAAKVIVEMGAVAARNALSQVDDPEVLRSVIALDTRKMIREKAEGRLRTLNTAQEQ